MIFTATLDKTTKILTIGITLLFAGIVVVPKLLGKTETTEMIITGIILGLIYGISYAFSPKSYELNETELIINRPLNKVVLKYHEIKNTSKIGNNKLNFAIRLLGVGGLFGYFGKFWNKEFGSMTWYATRRENAIMITTKDDKRIILTPDETEKFISEFNKLTAL